MPQLDKQNGCVWVFGIVGVLALASAVKHTGSSNRRGSRRMTKWGTKSNALSKAQRARLPKSDFAIPQRRKYPIQDRRHGELALTYATWSATSRKDLPKVKRAVFARYPSLRRWWNNTDWVKANPQQRVARRAA